MKCVVQNCKNEQKDKEAKKTFFLFPREKTQLKRWLKFCNNKKTFKPKTWRICIDHFKDEDICGNDMFKMGYTVKRTLKPGAIPCLYNIESSVNQERSERATRRESSLYHGNWEDEIMNITPNDKRTDMKRNFSPGKNIKEESLDTADKIHTERSTKPNMFRKQRICSWENLSWTCYYCSKEFLSFKFLKSHIQSLHNIFNPENIHYQCGECKVLFFSYASFVSHTRSVHHNSLKLCCDVCNEVFPNYKRLSNHRDAHKRFNVAQPIVYQCFLCEVVQTNETQLKKHFFMCHNDGSQQSLNMEDKIENADPLEISEHSSNTEDQHSPLSVNQCKDEYFETEHSYQCGKCNHNFVTESDLEVHSCNHIELSENRESEQLLKPEKIIRRKPHKRKANWSQAAESLLCQVWEEKIDSLRSTHRTWHIYSEMRQALNERGCHLSIAEVKAKVHNLTSKYNKEKTLNGGLSSDWPLFMKVHKILESKKGDEISEESTNTFIKAYSNKKTEMESTEKNILPDLSMDDISASYLSSSDKSEYFEPKKIKTNQLIENSSQVADENDDLCETPENLTFKIYKEKVKQTKLMQKMYEEEAKKTKLMEKFVNDNTEFKNAFIKFLSEKRK